MHQRDVWPSPILRRLVVDPILDSLAAAEQVNLDEVTFAA
jgi:hypothetical protein